MRNMRRAGVRAIVAACLPAAFAAAAEEARYFVDIAACMALPGSDERAACYESLAALVRRAQGFRAAEPPAPPAPPAPAEPPAPPSFGDRGARLLRIEEGSTGPAWRLGDEVGVWVDPRGGANILLILERGMDGR